MSFAPYEVQQEDGNPLDMIEDLVRSKSWKFERTDDDYIVIQAQGQKVKYEICMEWQDEFSALLFACSLPVAISEPNYESAIRTLDQINQNLWLGHFDMSNKNQHPTFRYTLMLRLVPSGMAVDMVHDLLDVAIAECDRFYTTFQLVQAGDVRLQDSLTAAVFETVGEA